MGKRRVRTVIDSEGEPLRLALAAEPGLVSPNQREAEAHGRATSSRPTRTSSRG